MYRLKASILFAILLGIIVPSFAQSPVLPTNHSRVLFHYDLTTGSSNIGTIYNTSGSFLTEQGWRPKNNLGQLKIYLNDYLPYEGTLEVKVTGLTGSMVTDDWVPFSIWSRKRAKFYLPDNSGNPSEGSFAFFKTDENNVYENTIVFKIITKSLFDPLKSNYATDKFEPINFNSSYVYTFRIVWRPGKIWFQIHQGDTQVHQKETEFRLQSEAFAYICLGRSDDYGSVADVVYSDLTLKGPDLPISFKDITKSTGAAFDTTTGGHSVCWSDINQDGKEDIYLSYYYKNNQLFIGGNQGSAFTEAASTYGLAASGASFSSVTSDFNNDGKVDIFVTSYGSPNRLFINKGGGLFEDQAGLSGIGTVNGSAANSLVFDLENDGDMDIYVANSGVVHTMYVNQLNGNFNKIDLTNIAPIGSGARAVAGDVNGDGYVDVFYPRRNTTCALLINNRSGSFTDEAATRGLAFSTDPNGTSIADLDNDGDLDLIIATYSLAGDGNPQVVIYQNNGSGNFTKVNSIMIESFAAVIGDVDNDGFQDFYVIRRDKFSSEIYDYTANIYRNISTPGSISFTLMSGTGADNVFIDGRGGAMADINDDGKLDIYAVAKGEISSNGRPYGRNALLLNTSSNLNNYLRIKILDQHGITNGIGSKIRVFKQGFMGQMAHLLGYREVTSIQGYQSMPSLIQHFGLGIENRADVQVLLPNGRTLTYANVAANQTLTINPYQVDPKELQKVKGDNQTAPVGTALDDSITVGVKDIEDRPLLGYSVSFTITQGGGSLNGVGPSVNVSTDQDGLARVKWTMGTTTGANTLEVVALKGTTHITGSPMTFNATASSGAASNMIKVSGDGQLGYGGDPLPNPIVVKVTDSNTNPISNYPVTFAIDQGGGGLGAGGTAQQVQVLTAADGTAQTNWRLGLVEGLQRVNAFGAFNAANPAVFTATAQTPQRRLTYVSGDRQIGTVNQTIAEPLRASLKDHLGTPVAGGTVRFIVISGGGTINGQTTYDAATGTDGIASVSPILGTV
ncbi:VCBS repeat-containing protein, partial [candidate division KSB1 bacterium]|nr:VCBS repeat-containing protein [candidate division KSB1 bacterium]